MCECKVIEFHVIWEWMFNSISFGMSSAHVELIGGGYGCGLEDDMGLPCKYM